MPNNRGKRLVVDACIARAAGGSGAHHEGSISARNFLVEFKKHDFIAGMNRDLFAEWKRHESSFARKWRRSMIGARRFPILDHSKSNQTIWTRINTRREHRELKQLMLKDRPLMEAALNTDKRIVSFDERSRKAFARTSSIINDFKKIIWVNPSKNENSIDWLRNGAKKEKCRLLETLYNNLDN